MGRGMGNWLWEIEACLLRERESIMLESSVRDSLECTPEPYPESRRRGERVFTSS